MHSKHLIKGPKDDLENMFVQAPSLPVLPPTSGSHSQGVAPLLCVSQQRDETSLLPLHASCCSWVSKAAERSKAALLSSSQENWHAA